MVEVLDRGGMIARDEVRVGGADAPDDLPRAEKEVGPGVAHRFGRLDTVDRVDHCEGRLKVARPALDAGRATQHHRTLVPAPSAKAGNPEHVGQVLGLVRAEPLRGHPVEERPHVRPPTLGGGRPCGGVARLRVIRMAFGQVVEHRDRALNVAELADRGGELELPVHIGAVALLESRDPPLPLRLTHRLECVDQRELVRGLGGVARTSQVKVHAVKVHDARVVVVPG